LEHVESLNLLKLIIFYLRAFSDISGFTSWSSVRDPAQVFILLQTVYEAFDKIAKHRRVFKIETIGDW
jgi:class 3 adenylate cyclase